MKSKRSAFKTAAALVLLLLAAGPGSAARSLDPTPGQSGPGQIPGDGPADAHPSAAGPGVAIIIGGHAENYALQTNIDNVTNNAYRVFRAAGYSAEDIYYLSPGPQDADGDSLDDRDAETTPGNVHTALQGAAMRLRPDSRFFLFMMSHGALEIFCADGCGTSGQISSKDLDFWLDELVEASGFSTLNVIIDASLSGSFIDRVDDVTKSISGSGRVIITSTDRLDNAYATANGAVFSDAFLDRLPLDQSLLETYQDTKALIAEWGYAQTPWLDDNGDGAVTGTDGTVAQNRYLTSTPAAPILAAIDNADGDGNYVVDWNDVPWAATYTVERDEDAGFGSPETAYTGEDNQLTVSGQAVGAWFYRVRASNSRGASGWSNTQEARVTPAAPVLNPIDNADGDGDYLITWSVVPGGSDYVLEEDDQAGFPSPTAVYGGKNPQCSVSGRTGGTRYYRVQAIQSSVSSPWSNVESVTVKPAAPILNPIANEDGDGNYVVDWSEVDGADSYQLVQARVSQLTNPTTVYTGANSQYSVTGQTGGTWFYGVRASNTAGNGPWSNVKMVTVRPATPVLAAIANADNDGNYLIDWNDVSGALDYGLQEADNASFSNPTTLYTGAESQYAVTGHAPGTWYYRVRGSNDAGDSPWSNSRSTTVQSVTGGDSFEDDDACGRATSTLTDGTVQAHTFHDEGDEDWLQFQTQAGKTYIFQVDNLGGRADAVLALYDRCAGAPLSSGHNAFGPTVRVEWDAPAAGTYYLCLLQNDPALYGEGTGYEVSITLDTTPPAAPRSLNASPDDGKLIVQWRKSPERDVTGYRIWWGIDSGPPYSHVDQVDGAGSTYYEIENLDNGTLYYVALQAIDFSDNISDFSPQIAARPQPSSDDTRPELAISLPTAGTVYSTTMSLLTVGGSASDSGNNLSRAHVHNLTSASEGWDYGLSGEADTFTVGDIALAEGENAIQVTVFDSADNSGLATLTVRRLSGLNGVVVIAGGRNSSGSLQSNINYVTDRAYRVFQAAGIPASDIYYLSPNPRDADGDGTSDVRATTSPANLHAALQWAAGRLSPGVPFYLYLMDHGDVEVFCAENCTGGHNIGSQELDGWLDELEASSGCEQVNVVIDACHSGSFVDKHGDHQASISKNGRVVIASTSRTANAYASAAGALFSDAFFSAVADSRDLLASFEHARAAVEAASDDQTPWLDDNGDGLYNPADGDHARDRCVARYFGAVLPQILSASVQLDGQTGQIEGTISPGAEPLRSVWAAVYAPSFQPPDETTLNLGVPLVELEVDPEEAGHYTASYNGFLEEGAYRLVIYAEDEAANQAPPRVLLTGGQPVYLPIVVRE